MVKPNNENKKQSKKYPVNALTMVLNGLPIIFNIKHTTPIIIKFIGTDAINAIKLFKKLVIIVSPIKKLYTI